MIRTSITFCIVLWCIGLSYPLRADLARVVIGDGTLKTPDGETLRGAPFFMDVYGVPDMREREPDYRHYFEQVCLRREVNCIRINPWIGRWQYDIVNSDHHQKELLYMLDTVVDWCGQNDVYAIVNLHIEYNTPVDLQKAMDAWSLLAPRYCQKPHVIFELVNEPEPTSSLRAMGDLYQHVRSLAPETHLILFSHVAATQFTKDNLQQASQRIDYSNASIGFHCYDSVLQNTTQWDRAASIQQWGYPVICTEFICLTNNNDMPLNYEAMMHCIMRAEERKFGWISWGPFSQYRNANKKGWEHKALQYSQAYDRWLERFGLDFHRGPQWPADGKYRLQCVWGDGFLTNMSPSPWSTTEVSSAQDTDAGVWHLERFDGNTYRLRSAVGSQVYLHGDYKNDEPWRDVMTAELHTDWNSQQFQLRKVEENVYQIKCLWGDLYLTGRNLEDPDSSATNVRTAPLNVESTSQQWRLIPAE